MSKKKIIVWIVLLSLIAGGLFAYGQIKWKGKSCCALPQSSSAPAQSPATTTLP